MSEPLDIEAIRIEIEIASQTLSHLCDEKWAGRDGWKWSIPANEKKDTDLILSKPIKWASALCDEVEALRVRNKLLQTANEMLMADAQKALIKALVQNEPTKGSETV